MKAVGFFPLQCVSRSSFSGMRLPLQTVRSMSRPIMTLPAFYPPQSLPAISKHPQHLPRYGILPFQSILSSFTPHRPFSATPTKPEKRENIYTIPNILTFTRILSTPAIAYLILTDRPYLATSFLLYAGLTDLVDGWIARRYNLQSVVGTVIDPMADKFLMITLTGALAYTGAMPGISLCVCG